MLGFAIAVFLLMVATPLAHAKRVALAVGINRYDNLPRERQLAKAVNDARAMEVALKSVGFESSGLRMWDARLPPGLAATPRCCRAQGEDLSK